MNSHQRLGARLAAFMIRSRGHATAVIAAVAAVAVAGSLAVRWIAGPGLGTAITAGILSCALGYWAAHFILRGAAALGRFDEDIHRMP